MTAGKIELFFNFTKESKKLKQKLMVEKNFFGFTQQRCN
jgi:hypothetical protein